MKWANPVRGCYCRRHAQLLLPPSYFALNSSACIWSDHLVHSVGTIGSKS